MYEYFPLWKRIFIATLIYNLQKKRIETKMHPRPREILREIATTIIRKKYSPGSRRREGFRKRKTTLREIDARKRNTARRPWRFQIYHTLDRERLNLDRVVSRLRICPFVRLFLRTLVVTRNGATAWPTPWSRPGLVPRFTADGR